MKIQKTEKGQTLVLIVISVIVMVAMASLIVDGGNMYMNRRAAQTAADAAALAGAYEYCINGVAYPISEVTEYATSLNNASTVEDLTITSSQLEVTVSITKPTFFGKVFNQPTTTVQAKAAASCYTPKGVGNLLPIAWSCRAPEGDEDNLGSDCTVQSIPTEIFKSIQASGFQFDTYLLDVGDEVTAASYQTDLDHTGGEGKLVYVVMDSNKFDLTTCEEPQWGTGNINCDFNDDGILDLEGRGDRGWLSFDGVMGASDLKDIMLNGYEGDVTDDTWYAGAPGNKATVFDKAKQRIGEVLLLPVYNAVCDNTKDPLEEEACKAVVQPGDLSVPTSGNHKFFRVSAFAPFVITCVSEGQNEYCPGKDYAGLYGDKDLKKDKTIEGYFVNGVVIGEGAPGGNFDLGVYVLSLTE
jgi:hypothetical protein